MAKLKYDRIAEDLTPIVSGLVDSRFLCAGTDSTLVCGSVSSSV